MEKLSFEGQSSHLPSLLEGDRHSLASFIEKFPSSGTETSLERVGRVVWEDDDEEGSESVSST